MVATPVVAQHSRSKKLIEGCPAPLAYYGDLFINLDKYLSDIIEECRKEEVVRIQALLPQKDKGWEPIAKDFRIQWDNKDGSFVYGTTAKSNKKAMEIEYGSPGAGAKSILRHEVITANAKFGKAIERKLKKLASTGRSK